MDLLFTSGFFLPKNIIPYSREEVNRCPRYLKSINAIYSIIRQHLEKNQERLVEILTEIVKTEEENTSAYRNEGLICLLLGFRQSTIEHLNKAIELDPKDAQAYLCRGWFYYLRNLSHTDNKDDLIMRYEKATDDFIKATNRNPKYAQVYFPIISSLFCEMGGEYIAPVVYGATGDPQKALENYTKAVEFKPSFEVYKGRAEVYYILKKY